MYNFMFFFEQIIFFLKSFKHFLNYFYILENKKGRFIKITPLAF